MASVEFYIRNYKDTNGNIVNTETLFQTIPLSSEGPVITNPKVKTELGKAGSFEFGLELDSPYYDSMMQMNTIIRIVYFGKQLFRGRVLTIDRTLQRTRTVHCEGDLAFLLDSHQIGVKDEERVERSLETYLSELITQHNADIDDPQKQFTLGEYPTHYSESVQDDQKVLIPADKAKQQYGNSSWDTTMDRIEDVLSDFGGYWSTRYDASNGTTYLDWFDNYYRAYDGQDIEATKNLIDISGSTEVENLFTVVIPIGKKSGTNVFINDWWPQVFASHARVNYMTVAELATVPLYTDEELNSGYHRKEDYLNALTKYGKIWKVVDFENANTPERLFAYCKDWIKNNYTPELTQWDVTALDLHLVDGQTRPLFTGDRVKLIHPEVPQTYTTVTVISADYDLYSPEKNKFKIGAPNQQVNASYGVKQKSKGSSTSSGMSDSADSSDTKAKVDQNAADIAAIRAMLKTEYSRKVNEGTDIQLDNTFAFLVYADDGVTQRDPKDISADVSGVIAAMEQTKITKRQQLMAEAMRRGCAWDDVDLVMEFTPSVNNKRTTWKNKVQTTMVNDYGLSFSEAAVIVNDSVGSSTLASWVDDDGNWTPAAISRGASMWDPKVKQQCINARKLLKGETTTTGTGILGSAFSFLTGGGLNVGGMVDAFISEWNQDGSPTGYSFSLGDLGSGIGDVFNIDFSGISGIPGELVTKISGAFNSDGSGPGMFFQNTLDQATGVIDSAAFVLSGDNSIINGSDGLALFGRGENNNWNVMLNTTVEYTAPDGSTQTGPGFIAANDVKLPEVQSFKTKTAIIDGLIANNIQAIDAAVLRLSAAEAYISKINASTVTANTQVTAQNVLGGTVVSNSHVSATDYQLRTNGDTIHLGNCYSSASGSWNNGVWSLTLNRANGASPDTLSFNVAASNWYQQQIEAAETGGYTEGHADGVSETIDSIATGDWVIDNNDHTAKLPITVDGSVVDYAPMLGSSGWQLSIGNFANVDNVPKAQITVYPRISGVSGNPILQDYIGNPVNRFEVDAFTPSQSTPFKTTFSGDVMTAEISSTNHGISLLSQSFTLSSGNAQDNSAHWVDVFLGTSSGTRVGRIDVHSFYTDGDSAGYIRGESAGYTSGHSDGVSETIASITTGDWMLENGDAKVQIKAGSTPLPKYVSMLETSKWDANVGTFTASGATVTFRPVISNVYGNPLKTVTVPNPVDRIQITEFTPQSATSFREEFTGYVMTARSGSNNGVSLLSQKFALSLGNDGTSAHWVDAFLGTSSGTRVGRIDAHSFYTSGFNDVTVGDPVAVNGQVPSSDTRTSIQLRATASNGKSGTKTVSMRRTTYTVNNTQRRCVDLYYDSMSNVVGRITTQGVYDDGYDDGVASIKRQEKTVSDPYTSNDTVTITPDSGYDAMDKVTFTINVPSGGSIVQNDIQIENWMETNSPVGTPLSRMSDIIRGATSDFVQFSVTVKGVTKRYYLEM